MNTTHDHTWFTEHLATYLADGLQGEERSRFESHAAACTECAGELDRARADEQRLMEMFDAATPRAGLEDRIIARLRTPRSYGLTLHPWVTRALATAAAVVIVGGVGYVATRHLKDARVLVPTASNLRSIGQAVLIYSNDAKGGAARTNYPASAPVLAAEPFAGEVDRLAAAVRNRKHGNINNHDEDGQNVLRSDGRVAFQTNPFTGAKRDNVAAMTGGDVRAINGSMPSGGGFKPGDFTLGASLAQAGKDVALSEGKEVAGAGRELIQRHDALVVDVTDPMGPGQEFSKQVRVSESGNISLPYLKQIQAAGLTPDQLEQAIARAYRDMNLVQNPQIAVTTQQGPQSQQPAPQSPPTTTPAAVVQRKVIRNGEIAFEVDSFDSALSSITKIAAEETGFIATTNSEKLDNGKVKGTVVVRVSPDRLDALVMKLRALGDLKRQNLTAQDVTKIYHDLESELRAARAMEERLIEIIKTAKGEIKDLLAAEKELANWRGKIEKLVGEMNFYNNQVALSTLSIDLMERNLSTAAAATEQEDVNAGVEAEDVEGARAHVIQAIDEAKGRILEAELKKLDAGQLAAKIVAEVPVENAGPVIDRLKQLGKVARLDVQRRQTTPSGAAPAPGARVERKDTRLVVSLYNLANVAPRETSNLNLACADVERDYRTILARVEKAGGRVVSNALSREKADQVSGSIRFETKSAEAGAVLLDVRNLGELMRFAVTENPDTANVTTAKHGFVVQLFSAAQVAPRETVSVQLATADVSKAYNDLAEAAKAHGRVLASQVNESHPPNVTGTLEVEVARGHAYAFEQSIATHGDVLGRSATRAADGENTIDSKVRVQVALVAAHGVPPRETTTLGIESRHVDAPVTRIASIARSHGGRVIDMTLAREEGGRSAARVILDVPLAKAAQVVDQLKSLGDVRTERTAKNAQVRDGSLARARVEVTLATPQAIVAQGEGFWSSIRRGLGTSFAGLMWSVQILVVGLCFVVPWALLLWGGWKLLKRTRRATA